MPSVKRPALQIRLLGQPLLTYEGNDHSDLLVKGQALLFYLLLTPGQHSRSTLAGLLWSDMPEDKARTNLRTTLSHLRKRFPAHVITSRKAVSFDFEQPYWLDVEQFMLGLKGTRSANQQSAIDLYVGDFLKDFHFRGAPLFEEWVVVQRERLHQLALEGLNALSETQSAAGDYQQALDNLRRLLALDPWRESAHRRMMRLLVRMGNRSGAIAQYEACRRLLENELGVEPAQATQDLYEQIQRAEASAASSYESSPALRNNLPATASSFHGRVDDLAKIRATLQEPDCRLLTLTGMGGTGKTRLMFEAARQIMHDPNAVYIDGVCWVPLASAYTRQDVIAAIADAVAFTFSGNSDPQEQLFAYLSNKRLLLLLDNLEQLVDESPLFADLLHAAPRINLLATSRERLQLYEEWVLRIDGLPYPTSPSSAALEYDAVQLFNQRARRFNLGFDLEAEKDGVLAICQLVEGLPLGIELAASWTQTIPCNAIAKAISERRDVLSTTLRNVPQRHRSLQAAFDYSWNLITVAEQQMLAEMAVFQGGFAAAALVEITSQTDPFTCDRLLTDLVEKSLVRRDLEIGRFELHEQIRQFAWAKLAEAEQQSTALTHCHFYAQFVAQHDRLINVAGQQRAMETLRNESGNIRAAWHFALENEQYDALDKLTRPMAIFYIKQGLQLEGVRLFESALARYDTDAVRNGPDHASLLAKLLIYRSKCGSFSLPFDESMANLERGLAIARQHEQTEEIANALMTLGLISLVQAKRPAAIELLEEAIQISRQHHFDWILAFSLNLLSFLRNAIKERAAAMTLNREALTIFQELEDSVGAASTLSTRGRLHSDAGELEEASAAYAEALELCRRQGQRIGIAQALTGLFVVNFRQEKYEAASNYARQSLSANEDAGDRLGIAIAYYNLGFLAKKQADFTAAIDFFDSAVEMYQAIGSDGGRLASAHTQVAVCYLTLGKPRAAISHVRHAIQNVSVEAGAVRLGDAILVSGQYLLAIGEDGLGAGVLQFLLDNEEITDYVQVDAGRFLADLSSDVTPETFATYDAVLDALRRKL